MFGTMASGQHKPHQIFLRGTWVFLHLLQFCVSNQTFNPEEDSQNKPWRPIPSGRISLQAALRLRWTLLVVCILYSANCGVLVEGVILSVATIAYNELDLGSHWLMRNVLNAIGHACFIIGSTNVARVGTCI